MTELTPELQLANELRSASLVDAEVKGRTVHGLAAVYDQPWSDALAEKHGYTESFARGAFRKALSRIEKFPVPLLWQHERRDMLGTTKNGTLRLKDDARGLSFEGDLPDNALGNYVSSMIERGDVDGVSVGLASDRERVPKQMRRTESGYHRTIDDMHHLLDISLTYEPSYPASIIELRSLGFAALPLQEIVAGNEAQDDEAATGSASIAMVEYRKRIDAVRVAIIEEV